MKRICFLVIILVMLLSGCCNDEVPIIDDYKWVIASVQSTEDGSVIACGEEMISSFETAKQVDIVCSADGGILTLCDIGNDNTFTGEYVFEGGDSRSNIYKVTLNGKSGTAVAAMTTYSDGSQRPTFIIDFQNHVLNFIAE